MKETADQYKEALRQNTDKMVEQEAMFTRNFESLRQEAKNIEK